MEKLGIVYFALMPVIVAAGLVEAWWLSRTRREAYDWKAWWCSLADLVGRRVVSLIPLAIAAPWFVWAYDHRFFTQDLGNVWSVLLLFLGVEFFYYWYHRASHQVRWFWMAHSPHHSPNQLNLSAAAWASWARPSARPSSSCRSCCWASSRTSC
ncbi:MAG: sterol desaturase family protein [Enhydrobacter sp.]|nr:MAG: sterol desaturase family protein [Enhydrobacter sp.]